MNDIDFNNPEIIIIKHYDNFYRFEVKHIDEMLSFSIFLKQTKGRIDNLSPEDIQRLKGRCGMREQRIIYFESLFSLDYSFIENFRNGFNTFETITQVDSKIIKGESKQKEIKENDPIHYLCEFDKCDADKPIKTNIETSIFSVKVISRNNMFNTGGISDKYKVIQEIEIEEKLSPVRRKCANRIYDDEIKDNNLILFYLNKNNGEKIIYCYRQLDLDELIKSDPFVHNHRKYFVLPDLFIPVEEMSLRHAQLSNLNTFLLEPFYELERNIVFVDRGSTRLDLKEKTYKLVPASRNDIFSNENLFSFRDGLDSEFEIETRNEEKKEIYFKKTNSFYEEKEEKTYYDKYYISFKYEDENENENLLMHSTIDYPSYTYNQNSSNRYSTFMNIRRLHKWNYYGFLERNGKPAVIRYKNGKIKEEYWFYNDILDRQGNEPAITFHYDNDVISDQYWYQNNVLVREDNKSAHNRFYENGSFMSLEIYQNEQLQSINDNPAYIEYYKNEDINVYGPKKIEEWYENGKLDRPGDQPAFLSYYENGRNEEFRWCRFDKIHREGNKPARLIYYDKNEKVLKLEQWYTEGKLNRDQGCASIQYNPDGSFYELKWMINDKFHRLNAPAEIRYSTKPGRTKESITTKCYFENKLQSYNDQPAVVNRYNNRNLNVSQYEWYTENKLDRSADQPAVIKFFDSKEVIIKEQQWLVDGKLNRNNDRPSIIVYALKHNEDGKLAQSSEMKKYEKWYKNNELHRENDRPALIKYSLEYIKNGLRNLVEMYYFEDKMERKNGGPTIIEYYDDISNNVKHKWWISKNDLLHRENGPAFISYNNNNLSFVNQEQWFIEGKLCVIDDKPSIVTYYNDLKHSKREERWMVDNKLDRNNDKPALIRYNQDESKKEEHWYIDGKLERDYGLPAIVKYDDEFPADFMEEGRQDELNTSGPRKSVEEWYKNEQLIYKKYYKNGIIRREKWFGYEGPIIKKNGYLSRLVYIDYYENGSKAIEEYYNSNNSSLDPVKEIIKYYRGELNKTGNPMCLILKKNYYEEVITYYDKPHEVPKDFRNFFEFEKKLGIIKNIKWFYNNKFYRTSKKPSFIEYYDNGFEGVMTSRGIKGCVKSERWIDWKNYLKTKGKPIHMEYYNHGTEIARYVKKERWNYNNNYRSQKDLPVSIVYYDTRLPVEETKYRTNENFSYKTYNQNELSTDTFEDTSDPSYSPPLVRGDVKQRIWDIFSDMSRPGNAPNNILYYKNGSIQMKLWYLNGVLHRDTFPAVIKYYKPRTDPDCLSGSDPDCESDTESDSETELKIGTIKSREWYINGRKVEEQGISLGDYEWDENLNNPKEGNNFLLSDYNEGEEYREAKEKENFEIKEGLKYLNEPVFEYEEEQENEIFDLRDYNEEETKIQHSDNDEDEELEEQFKEEQEIVLEPIIENENNQVFLDEIIDDINPIFLKNILLVDENEIDDELNEIEENINEEQPIHADLHNFVDLNDRPDLAPPRLERQRRGD